MRRVAVVSIGVAATLVGVAPAFAATAPPLSAPLPVVIDDVPKALQVTSLNRDRIPDVVVVASDGQGRRRGSVTALLGNGDGTFRVSAAIAFISAFDPVAVDTADLDGDGDTDVVVGGRGTREFRVLLGDGLGGLDLRWSLRRKLNDGDSLLLGNMDLDKIPDLAILRPRRDGTLTDLVVHRGKGNGTFDSGRLVGPGRFANRLLQADLNSDRRSDLVVLEWRPSPTADRVRYGVSSIVQAPTGLGVIVDGPSFDVPDDADVSFPLGDFISGDLTGDGHIDVVVGVTNSGVFLAAGNGDGTLAAFRRIPGFSERPTDPPLFTSISTESLALGDMNGDGVTDLAISGYPPGYVKPGTLLGDGMGNYRDFVPFPTGRGGTIGFRVADLNIDGRPDVIVMASRPITLDPRTDKVIGGTRNLGRLNILLNAPSRPAIANLRATNVRSGLPTTVLFSLSGAAFVDAAILRGSRVVRRGATRVREAGENALRISTAGLRPGRYSVRLLPSAALPGRVVNVPIVVR